MHEAVISDTSCLIVLQKIGCLDILQKLYGTVTTTPEIAKEFGEILPDWFIVRSSTDKNLINVLASQIDIDESSAIALALEIEESTIIIVTKKPGSWHKD